MNFELAVRAEIATLHEMHEKQIELKLPLEMYLDLGYSLITENPQKWEAIQNKYKPEIERCLSAGRTFKNDFIYKPLFEGE